MGLAWGWGGRPPVAPPQQLPQRQECRQSTAWLLPLLGTASREKDGSHEGGHV